jgi:hypothetical protein
MGNFSLSQGRAFEEMTRNLHGGRRSRRDRHRKMRGGGGEPGGYPFSDSLLLSGADRVSAQQGQMDQFYRDSQSAIPSEVRSPQSGGGLLSPAMLSQPDMLLSRSMSDQALNQQWRTEGGINPEVARMAEAEVNYRSTNSPPGFNGAYATQAGGRRRSRRNRRATRKHRKNRKGSRRNRH